MKLSTTIDLYAGGPGSGCKGSNCGRPSSGEKFESTLASITKSAVKYLDDHLDDGEFHHTASDVNQGFCAYWAKVVYDSVPGVKLYSTNKGGGHAFVKIGSKYYDAQNKKGVTDWHNLKMFQLIKKGISDTDVREVSVKKLVKEWEIEDQHVKAVIKGAQ